MNPHAAEWRLLADQERKRPEWDHCYLPALAERKAKLYEDTARAIELEEKTGVAHCACHLIPMAECAALARAKARSAR